jgi:hypothetical protein
MLLLAWLYCLATIYGRSKLPPDDGDEAVAILLRDRRLTKTKGLQVTSFVGGSVITFLRATSLFLDSTVLAAVSLSTLSLFTPLVVAAVNSPHCFKTLYRSSRDGANAAAFHRRCDAQGPTLTLIRDTAGNVFGGYTSLQWSSPATSARDVRLNDHTAFLFSVVNPHADPPALFPSLANGRSIVCVSSVGPWFNRDLCVTFDERCRTCVGDSYENPTQHSGFTVLTGAIDFTPEEVEVWGLAHN